MSGATGLDIRLPIGWIFTALGVLLSGYALISGGAAANQPRATSIDLDIDLWWGLVMLVFGIIMLIAAHLGHDRDTARPATETPEGQATEERERRLGLER